MGIYIHFLKHVALFWITSKKVLFFNAKPFSTVKSSNAPSRMNPFKQLMWQNNDSNAIQCPQFKKEEKFHFSKELFSLNFFLAAYEFI